MSDLRAIIGALDAIRDDLREIRREQRQDITHVHKRIDEIERQVTALREEIASYRGGARALLWVAGGLGSAGGLVMGAIRDWLTGGGR